MKILTLNSGSSSIKFKLFDMEGPTILVSGLVEEIGTKNSKVLFKNLTNDISLTRDEPIPTHQDGIFFMNKMLIESGVITSFSQLDGIGHRIVHGGEYFKKSTILDSNSVELLYKISSLAPLHNPGHIAGIVSTMQKNPKIPNVGVFDTVFHQTLPDYAYMYALPYEFYKEHHVRKYGFHGTSHSYVSKEAAKFLGIDIDKFNAISLHIGNGASVCAIENGKSVDTSMGLSPLEGLMMGTRSGDIDPAIIEYLANQTGKGLSELDKILNKKSGLLGICGLSDMREIWQRLQKGDKLCRLAYDMYNYRIIKYIGAYYAVLGRVDALIFTAGVGENALNMRNDVCKKLTHLGILIDEDKNSQTLNIPASAPSFDPSNKKCSDYTTKTISKDDSKIPVLVVHTNEELAIALETKRLIEEKKN